VTIAIRPLSGWMAQTCRDVLPDGESEIFFAKGLDTQMNEPMD